MRRLFAALLFTVLAIAGTHAQSINYSCDFSSSNPDRTNFANCDGELAAMGGRASRHLSVSQAGNDITATSPAGSPPITAYALGQRFSIITTGANTGAMQIKIDGLAFKALVSRAGAALASGDAPAAAFDVLYDGTSFRIVDFTGTAGGGGGGEANTASNVGTAGVGPFKQKTGVNLEFRNVNAGSNKIGVALDAGNNEIDVDANEANFTLGNLGGILPVTKGGNGAAPGGDDQTLVSSSAAAASWLTIPDSDGATQKLQYDQATNAFSAGTDDDVPESGDFGALSVTAPLTISAGNLSTSIATARIMGRTTAGAGVMEELTAAQARGVLGLATTDSVTFAGITSSANIVGEGLIADGTGDGAAKSIECRSDAAFNCNYLLRTGGSNRGGMRKGSQAETGSDAGSNNEYIRCSDAGACTVWMSVVRTGAGVTVSDPIILNGAVSGTGLDTSAEIAAIVGNETGSGLLVFNDTPTLVGVPKIGDGAGNDNLEFIEEATNPTCSSGDYRVWANSANAKLKKCENGTISDLDTSGGSLDINGLTGATPAMDDTTPFYDVSATANRKVNYEDLFFERAKNRARNGFEFYADFVNTPGTNGDTLNAIVSTGSVSFSTSVDPTSRPGIIAFNTSTSAAGRAALVSNGSMIALGGGDWYYETDVYVDTLSTSGERFQFVTGFMDASTAADQVDCVLFLYDEGGVSSGSTASANWQLETCSNGSGTSNRTWTTTSTAVSATTWYRLGIQINAAASSVEFFIDGTSVGTHTTNIPTGSSRVTGFGALLIKSVGTTSRTVRSDYINVVNRLTTER